MGVTMAQSAEHLVAGQDTDANDAVPAGVLRESGDDLGISTEEARKDIRVNQRRGHRSGSP